MWLWTLGLSPCNLFFWEYLLPIFGIGSLQCILTGKNPSTTGSGTPTFPFTIKDDDQNVIVLRDLLSLVLFSDGDAVTPEGEVTFLARERVQRNIFLFT
jgi:hypothetical protein